MGKTRGAALRGAVSMRGQAGVNDLAAFFSCLAARFSFIVRVGFFFVSFFWFMPLLMALSSVEYGRSVRWAAPSMRLPGAEGAAARRLDTRAAAVFAIMAHD